MHIHRYPAHNIVSHKGHIFSVDINPASQHISVQFNIPIVHDCLFRPLIAERGRSLSDPRLYMIVGHEILLIAGVRHIHADLKDHDHDHIIKRHTDQHRHKGP